MRISGILAAWLLLAVAAWAADEPAWKTVYVKRGFVGNFDANWAGGVGATLRMRVPMPVAGTQVRVYVRGAHDVDAVLTRMALVKGADDAGKIAGPLYPVTFDGQPGLTLDKGFKERASDAVEVPVTPGTWYLQDSYSSAKFPYAYDVDAEFAGPPDSFEKETLGRKITSRVGIVTRIDVLTTDTRPSIACWGDSITHGYGSTPNGNKRYPDVLAKLLDRPTLNLGVNGDQVKYSGGMAGTVGALKGVDTVIFLMGINDICVDPKFTKEDFVLHAKRVIDAAKAKKVKLYLGTLPPAVGSKAFGDNANKEALRQAINAWLRTEAKADGLIDFDAAVADPAHPEKFGPDLHNGDWLHPSDAGYQKMAEAAAKVLREAK
jgi:lysophospholipase L1-like esterase